jgi:hypothetical protein
LPFKCNLHRYAEGYGAFIAAYDVSEGEGEGSGGGEKITAKTPPLKLPDDEERTYLTARFVRARVVSKSHGAGSEVGLYKLNAVDP